MIVCVCKCISDREVRDAVRNGHDSVDALGACLGVGTGCGSCVEFAGELIDESRRADCAQAVPA